MRTVRDRDLGKFRRIPYPLEVCPGRPIWERQRGSEYLVFVDESFHNFFGFADIDGNFCHAALGVPINGYPLLERLMAPSVNAYKIQTGQMTGKEPKELKSTQLAKLPLQFRIEFARDLVRNLASLGGFVAGFFSTTRGIVMERVRVNLLGEASQVPADHTQLYNDEL